MVGLMMPALSEAVNLACCIGLLVLLWPTASSGYLRRLQTQVQPQVARSFGAGTVAGLASLASMLRCGGALVDSAEMLAGRRFATRELDLKRCYEVMWKCRGRDENPEQVHDVAVSLRAACLLSEDLGCEAARCLDAAAAACRRARLVDELRNKAFSMPKATVRLLSVLPVIAIAVAQSLGIEALSFLLSTTPGLLCLALGSLCYCLGMLWIRALMRTNAADGIAIARGLGS
jgi:tight adherence protein B